jgi:NIPSNAP
MATQLREYRIVDAGLAQFVEVWRTHLAPLRRSLGFEIDGAWTVAGESRFVWLLSHPGGWDAFEESDRRYFASPERAAISPDPAQLIEEQFTWRLEPAATD